jgi:hypothetical protein
MDSLPAGRRVGMERRLAAVLIADAAGYNCPV